MLHEHFESYELDLFIKQKLKTLIQNTNVYMHRLIHFLDQSSYKNIQKSFRFQLRPSLKEVKALTATHIRTHSLAKLEKYCLYLHQFLTHFNATFSSIPYTYIFC